jgi:SAM-dependent methyltransferase
MTTPFCRSADAYDETYGPPDQAAVDLYCRWLGTPKPPRNRLVEIGCGTGRWMTALQGRGWHVMGLDPNPAMVSRARAKGLHVIQGGLYHASLGPHDALVAPFTVLGYAVQEFQGNWSMFRRLRRAARRGTVLAFDIIQHQAVLTCLERERCRRLPGGMVRHDLRTYDAASRNLSVQMTAFRTDDPDATPLVCAGPPVWSELHRLRCFDVQEIRDSLERTCWRPLIQCPLESPDDPVTDSTWHVFFAAEAT